MSCGCGSSKHGRHGPDGEDILIVIVVVALLLSVWHANNSPKKIGPRAGWKVVIAR